MINNLNLRAIRFPGVDDITNNDTINHTIKPIDRKESNAELEAKEITLDPETKALHKVLGKRHSAGGTPVNLKPGSFIFSDYNKLKITPKQAKEFELEIGKKNLTPAQLLEKNVNLKDHNRFIKILNSFSSDSVEQNTAALNINTNLIKTDRVASIQEMAKKKLLPNIHPNSAPVYSDNMDQKISQTEQFQKGGTYMNNYDTYLPWQQNLYDFYDTPLTEEQKVFDTQNVLATQQFGVDKNPELIKYLYRNQLLDLNNASPSKNITDLTDQQILDQHKDGYYVKDRYSLYKGKDEGGNPLDFTSEADRDNYVKQKNLTYVPTLGLYTDNLKGTPSFYKMNVNQQAEPVVEANKNTTELTPGDINIKANQPFKAGLTGYQKLNAAYPFFKAATVQTQYPMRQQRYSVVPQTEQVSAQGQLNNVYQQLNQALQGNRANNPTVANAQTQSLFGKTLDQTDQIIANTQISNNQSQLQASTRNNDLGFNQQEDKNYYNDINKALLNKQRLKEFYTNQGITNLNTTLEQNQKFEAAINSNPYSVYTPVKNFFGYSTVYDQSKAPKTPEELMMRQAFETGADPYLETLKRQLQEAIKSNDTEKMKHISATIVSLQRANR